MAPRPLDPRPKAVIFDLDDTLCDYAAARETRLRRAFTLSHDGGTQSRDGIDLDRMIAESIRMHPHGADHFAELFARFGIADARAGSGRSRLVSQEPVSWLTPVSRGGSGVLDGARWRVTLTIPRRLARLGS